MDATKYKDLADRIKKRDPSVEDEIATIRSDRALAYFYARYVHGGRWLAGEPAILTIPVEDEIGLHRTSYMFSLFQYALAVVKDRWVEREEQLAAFLQAQDHETVRPYRFEQRTNLLQLGDAILEYVEQYRCQAWPELFEHSLRLGDVLGLDVAIRDMERNKPERVRDLLPFLASSPWFALHWARDTIGGRWLDAEAYLSVDPLCASRYAVEVMGSRWEAAEPAILTSPQAARDYAFAFFEDGWPKAEPLIFDDGLSTRDYAREYGRRMPGGEAAVIRDGQAAHYASEVIGGPWPEAEAEIAKEAFGAAHYAAYVIRGRWPAGEAAIATEAYPSLLYAQLLGQRFEAGEPVLLESHYAAEYRAMAKSGQWPDPTKPDPEAVRASAAKLLDALEARPDKPSRDLPGLEELIGLDSVKDELRRLQVFANMQGQRRRRGLKTSSNTLHMVFTGNPGTGKTTVARLVGQIYQQAGLLPSDKVVEVKRADLVANYVGQTEGKVLEQIEKADGGVLFVDEAYTLAPPHEQIDFGREVIETLLAEMEIRRDSLAVIVAGYPDDMGRFLDANPGLKSRFSRKLHFPDYEPEDMVRIFEKMAHETDYVLERNVLEPLHDRFAKARRRSARDFGNGRLVRNVFERTIENLAMRLDEAGHWRMDELNVIEASDLPADFIDLG